MRNTSSTEPTWLLRGIFFTLFLIMGGVLFVTGHSAFAQTQAETEAQLQRELEKTEKEIREQEAILNRQRSQSNLIEGEVNKLTGQINLVQKDINAKAANIQSLGQDISIKDQTVSQLNEKLDRSKEILADLIRTTDKTDDISLVEILFAYDNISDFFSGLDSLISIQASLDSLLDQVRELRGLTEEEKIKLEEKKQRELDLKKQVEAEKQQVAIKQSEQKDLLATSRETEQTYAQILAEKQAKAASIRSALFRLRDAAGISFEEAMKYAQSASKSTGVRPAFILGILKQESNIGQNVGSCVITDLESGATQGVNTQTVFSNGIHPTRDLPTLQVILDKLGRDPMTTRVSCPQSVGYGGAMGPSQFIPSTWQSYIGGLQQIFGVYPDPWNPEHSITATALFLRDLGAGAQTHSSEFEAAGRYYAGGNWQTYGQSYANSVLSHAKTFQDNIDFLETLD